MRDRAKHPGSKYLFGVLALGWRGSARHWQRYEAAYLIMAGLSTPLVLSVHSIVSLDFAVGIVPGWHTTIFPPYFVAGAVFAGFAMVLMLAIPVRNWYKLKDFITDKHLDWCARIMLMTGLIVVYGYACEAFYGWYAGGREWEMIVNRAFGPYWLDLLAAHSLQRHYPADHVEQEMAAQRTRADAGLRWTSASACGLSAS